MLASAFSFLDRLALSLLIEPVKKDLQLTDAQVSLLAGTAFAISYVLFAFVFGRWVDTRERKMAIVVGVSLWSAATAACGLARNFGSLFAARTLVGVGEASLNPAGYSLIADYFPPVSRSFATAIFACGATVGGGLAIMAGGLLVDWVISHEARLPLLPQSQPWQVVFVAIGLPGLLVALLIALTVREPARLLAAGENEAPPLLGEAMAYIVANRRVFGTLFPGYAFIAVIGYSFMVWGPVHFMRLHHLAAGEVGGLLGLGYGIGGTIGLLCGGLLADRLVARGMIDAPVRVTLAVVAIETPLFMGAYLIKDFVPAASLFCLGMTIASVVGGLQVAMVQSLAPNRLRGVMAAVFGACVNVAGFGIAPFVTATIAEAVFGGPFGIGKALALTTAVSGVCALLLITSGSKAARHLAKSVDA